MDANTRHFAAEIEAQHLQEEPQEPQLHADAEVAVVTAL
jgi:hypothetical protein